MKLKNNFIYTILAGAIISSSLMVGCSNDSKPSDNSTNNSNKKSELVKEDLDYENLNTKEVNDSIEEYGKQLGISNVKKISIDWQLASERFSDKEDTSKYLFAQKKVDIDSPYIISKFMKYMVDAKMASQDELYGLTRSNPKSYMLEKKEKVDSINSELDKIKSGKIKDKGFNYIQHGGYFYFPNAKKGNFSEYRPSFKLIGKDGKSLEFDFKLDGLQLMMNKKGNSEIKIFSEDGYDYFYNIMAAKDLSDKIGKDAYKTIKENKLDLDYLMSVKTIRMPEKLKEKTFGDRFNLYWAGVDTLIKSNGFHDGLSKYLGKDITVKRYHIKPFNKLVYSNASGKSQKMSEGQINGPNAASQAYDAPENNQKVYESVDNLVILRSGNKQIGAYLCSDLNIYSLDKKDIGEVTGGTYEAWLDKVFENDADGQEIGKLDSHGFIKKYVDMMTVPDFNVDVFNVPKLDEYSGKINDLENSVVDQFYKNIISANLISITNRENTEYFSPDSKQKPNDIALDVVIDYKFKDEITLSNGETQNTFVLRKISDKLGYRIVSQGI